MKKNLNFKIIDKDKKILWLIISIITTLFLVSFIATSFGHIDEDFSATFYKSMDIKFFRGWASYTIKDGYISSVPFGFFYGVIIAESFYKWKKKRKPRSWFAQHQKTVILWLVGLGIVDIGVECYILIPIQFSYGEMGWVDHEFMIGLEYEIPEFIVSMVVNTTIYIVLTIYLHKVIAKRPGFIETKPWRQSLYNLLFMLVMMIVINIILKNVTGRPYWYNIHFTDYNYPSSPLSKLAHDYPDDYYRYITQQNTNWGWIQDPSNRWIPKPGQDTGYKPNQDISWVQQQWNAETNWRWWKIGPGWINNQYTGHFYNDAAWPSGHMASTTTMCLCATFMFNSKIKSKKHNFWKWFWIVIIYLYILDVAFALQTSTSHWWSDTSFTVVIVPLGYLLSKWTINSIMNRINKTWDLEI